MISCILNLKHLPNYSSTTMSIPFSKKWAYLSKHSYTIKFSINLSKIGVNIKTFLLICLIIFPIYIEKTSNSLYRIASFLYENIFILPLYYSNYSLLPYNPNLPLSGYLYKLQNVLLLYS